MEGWLPAKPMPSFLREQHRAARPRRYPAAHVRQERRVLRGGDAGDGDGEPRFISGWMKRNRETFRKPRRFRRSTTRSRASSLTSHSGACRSGPFDEPGGSSSRGRAPRWRRRTRPAKSAGAEAVQGAKATASSRQRPGNPGYPGRLPCVCLARYPAAAFTAIGVASSPLASGFRESPSAQASGHLPSCVR